MDDPPVIFFVEEGAKVVEHIVFKGACHEGYSMSQVFLDAAVSYYVFFWVRPIEYDAAGVIIDGGNASVLIFDVRGYVSPYLPSLCGGNPIVDGMCVHGFFIVPKQRDNFAVGGVWFLFCRVYSWSSSVGDMSVGFIVGGKDGVVRGLFNCCVDAYVIGESLSVFPAKSIDSKFDEILPFLKEIIVDVDVGYAEYAIVDTMMKPGMRLLKTAACSVSPTAYAEVSAAVCNELPYVFSPCLIESIIEIGTDAGSNNKYIKI